MTVTMSKRTAASTTVTLLGAATDSHRQAWRLVMMATNKKRMHAETTVKLLDAVTASFMLGSKSAMTATGIIQMAV